jgi:hypothetical protein
VKLERFLIISAGGETRVVHRMPALALDEFAYRLTVEIPDSWASVLGEITVRLPDPDPSIELDQVEPDEVEEE